MKIVVDEIMRGRLSARDTDTNIILIDAPEDDYVMYTSFRMAEVAGTTVLSINKKDFKILFELMKALELREAMAKENE
jgi:hypothetical protein